MAVCSQHCTGREPIIAKKSQGSRQDDRRRAPRLSRGKAGLVDVALLAWGGRSQKALRTVRDGTVPSSRVCSTQQQLTPRGCQLGLPPLTCQNERQVPCLMSDGQAEGGNGGRPDTLAPAAPPEDKHLLLVPWPVVVVVQHRCGLEGGIIEGQPSPRGGMWLQAT